MTSRDAYEHMLIALEVADTWSADPATAKLAASTVSGPELAAGMVSLIITLRRTIAKDHGMTLEQVSDAIRRKVITEMADC